MFNSQQLKMQKILIFCFCLILFGCQKSAPLHKGVGQQSTVNSQHSFTIETRCPVTPVKNQGRSSSCWIYAMLATIESNRLAMGDSVNLSTAYYERKLLAEQAERIFLTPTHGNMGTGKINMRGMIPHLMTMFHRYGAFSEMAYHHINAQKNFNVLVRELELFAKQTANNARGITPFREKLNTFLDREIGYLPGRMFMLGAEYTPMEFGHSVALLGSYEFLGADYAFPDRRESDVIKSTAPKALLTLTEKTVRAGKAVCWEGDISEPGFDWRNGIAETDYDAKTAIVNYYKDIENFKTTDDHCLEICGIAHDENGEKYFICKNSWGTDNRFCGFLFMQFNYFLAKTLLIGYPKF